MLKKILAVMFVLMAVQPSMASEKQIEKYTFSTNNRALSIYLPPRFKVVTNDNKYTGAEFIISLPLSE